MRVVVLSYGETDILRHRCSGKIMLLHPEADEIVAPQAAVTD